MVKRFPITICRHKLVSNLANKVCLPECRGSRNQLEGTHKMVLRPSQISKFSPQYPSHCFRGCSTPGTQVHIWWECNIVRSFWSEVFNILSTMFKVILLPDTHIALVNSKPHALSNRQFKLMLFVTAAKQVIAKVWKTDSLDISLVKQGVTQSSIHAKTEAIYLDNISKFKALWTPWIEHFLSPGSDTSLLLP